MNLAIQRRKLPNEWLGDGNTSEGPPKQKALDAFGLQLLVFRSFSCFGCHSFGNRGYKSLNTITTKGLNHISEMLETLESLQELHLSLSGQNTDFDDQGIIRLSQSIGNLKTLKKLHLSFWYSSSSLNWLTLVWSGSVEAKTTWPMRESKKSGVPWRKSKYWRTSSWTSSRMILSKHDGRGCFNVDWEQTTTLGTRESPV